MVGEGRMSDRHSRLKKGRGRVDGFWLFSFLVCLHWGMSFHCELSKKPRLLWVPAFVFVFAWLCVLALSPLIFPMRVAAVCFMLFANLFFLS